jgi:anti-anti-sigma regulatory factor
MVEFSPSHAGFVVNEPGIKSCFLARILPFYRRTNQETHQMEATTELDISGVDSGIDLASEQQRRGIANVLPTVLDFTQAQNLRDIMIAVLNDQSIVLDASTVERMSTPCAQVIVAAGRAADLASSSFRIVGASEAFRAALDDLGLQAEFEKWMV